MTFAAELRISANSADRLKLFARSWRGSRDEIALTFRSESRTILIEIVSALAAPSRAIHQPALASGATIILVEASPDNASAQSLFRHIGYQFGCLKAAEFAPSLTLTRA
jgi:hypothetical protein